ncbi:MAG: SMP-30/gluconolactonase/LRE family protein [Planctomycetaceae bacterium]|nr:SMP-30/gluconolactonase/LRE family protein [Planctomycetaceae bacterium]
MRLHSARAGLILLCLAGAAAAAETAPPTGDPAIIAADARLETLWNEGAFTEGVAVAPDGRIYFSDIPSDDAPGKIYRFDPATSQTDVYCHDSAKSNGLMFDRDGRLIACCGANHGGQSLAEITPDGHVRPLVDAWQKRRFNSPNDLDIHPDGSIYFSDPRYLGPEPLEIDHQSVYRYNPADQSVTRVTRDITKPNGVAVAPGGKTLYVAETDNRTVNVGQPPTGDAKVRMTLNAFPIKPDGTLGPKQVLVNFGDDLGIDGMAVDSEGHIYAAVRSASRFGIRIYDDKGAELASIPTPDLPTNCCFGIGHEATTLYITAGTGLYRIPVKTAGYLPATANR